MRYGPLALSLSCAIILAPSAASAQRALRDSYLSQLPPTPSIVRQRAATVKLRVYGDAADPRYRDLDPVDGIDDVRAERLAAIAERFSPILHLSASTPPRDFREALGGPVVLHADTWNDGLRVRSDSIELDGDHDGASDDDAVLRALLRDLHPERLAPRAVRAEGEPMHILFFDYPGEDERSWRRAHGDAGSSRSHIYAHFFAHENVAAPGANRHQLVVQYWFFYPYNDGPNNHEGDWEHINVAITTRSRATSAPDSAGHWALLDSADVLRILEGPGDVLDSLVIRAVDYYFHHHVMTLDYRTAYGFGRPATAPPSIWVDEDFVAGMIRKRLTMADGRLATHPLVFVGGVNKGPDELLVLRPRFLQPYNRESHGNYPFSGTWVAIGGLDATERIRGRDVPRLSTHADALPWHLLPTEKCLTYPRERITLLPDWERVAELVLDRADVRREWGWMLLPIRFGFPVSPSPGAGLVPRTDLGNLGAMSPTHNTAWNRLGEVGDYGAYEPSVLRANGAPVTPWLSMQSGFGALNLPLAAWGLLPGGNVATTQLVPWLTGTLHVLGAPPTRTFYDGPLPWRITTSGEGGFVHFGGGDYARMLPHPSESDAIRAMAGESADAAPRYSARGGVGARVWLNLFYRRFSAENTFGISWSDVSYTLPPPSEGAAPMSVSGRSRRRELLGGLRVAVVQRADRTLSGYVRGGYGWIDYRVDRLRANGAPLDEPARSGGYLLSLLPSRRWWPNATYLGLGVEAFAPRDRWLLDRLGYGVRLDATAVMHRLRSGSCAACGVNSVHGDIALSTVLGW